MLAESRNLLMFPLELETDNKITTLFLFKQASDNEKNTNLLIMR